MDILCKRFYNFIHACVNSVNGLLKYVVRQGVLFSGMKSCIGRNVQFLSERYQVCIPDMLTHNLAQSNITRICQRNVENGMDPEVFWQARLVYELVMVRDGLYRLTDDNFVSLDICQAIATVCTN